MHYQDANKLQGEKARWELQKKAMAVLKKSKKQHPIKEQLYVHLPSISQSKDNLTSDVLLWNPTR